MKKLLIPVALFLSACSSSPYQSVFKISSDEGELTAWAIDKHHLLSNAHGCIDRVDMVAEGIDGRKFNVKIEEIDIANDICLLSTRANLIPLALSDNQPRLGQKATTLGDMDGLFLSISEVYVGSSQVVLNIKCRIITAITWMGSSGSPVLDGGGKVIGMVFAVDTDTHTGFFIPVQAIRKFLVGVKSARQ